MRRSRRTTVGFIAAGLAVALLLAGIVSTFASSQPDGLDAATLKGCTLDEHGAITGGSCIAQREKEHELGGGPLAHYSVFGIDDPAVSTGVAGVLGVAITFAIGGGLFWFIRRRPGGGRDPSEHREHPSEQSGPDRAAPSTGDGEARRRQGESSPIGT